MNINKQDYYLGFSVIEIGDTCSITDSTDTEEFKREEDIEALRAYVIDELKPRVFCPFCANSLLNYDGRIDDFSDDQKFESVYSVAVCKKCGYWQFYEDAFLDRPPSGYIPAWDWLLGAASEVRTFEKELPEGVEVELAQNLIFNPRIWHEIDPTRLEQLVAQIFKANYIDCEVIHVGKSHDGGKDVIFIDSGKNQWLIQVKRREKENSTEGVNTLRCLLGTMVHDETKYGIIVSTANHFTSALIKEQKKYESLGFHIKLIDRGVLNEIVGQHLPTRPWLRAIEYLDPDKVEIYKKAIPKLSPDFCVLPISS